MRKQAQQRKVTAVKNRSRGGTEEQFVLEDDDNREYFRFEDGRVTEYDRTKANGHQLKLKPEEKEGFDEFEWSVIVPEAPGVEGRSDPTN
jgi:hypothetical protein